MANHFIGKVIAITGGASGMGLATAKSLVKLGAAVSLADVDATKLSSVASTIEAQTPGAKVLATPLDVRDRDGVAHRETPDVELDTVIGINLVGALNCVKEQFSTIRLVRSVSMEIAPYGMRITAIASGFINTPMTQNNVDSTAADHVASLSPLKLAGEPEDIAKLALFLLSD
ncbi:hypothetical protein FE257_003708 [Aspergillus nanangensis]|uniref:Uncharacterized protein n=1 Tax=Aspergillus nanangensis TaxID=2582783 RepID=A0AAD4CSC9_ASPNN|nr:hypothetical protein FE257_003708 [Aspergillus nanangensis]